MQMAGAITEAIGEGRHLLVQAGTGTGKSLGYLIPVLVELAAGRLNRVVIATATLGLQTQLAGKDIPAALDAVERATGRRPTTALLKGRTNYACRLRVNGGEPDAQQSLIEPDDLARTVHAGAGRSAATARPATATSAPNPADADSGSQSALGAEVLALREWAEDQHEAGDLADRDSAPPHTERAWQQVSIPVRECLGVAECAFGDSCFVEKSREQARSADLVVTNHALLAIDAMHGRTALPDHDVLIVDEAHELQSRVTGAASAELAPAVIRRTADRAGAYLVDAGDLPAAVEDLQAGLERCTPGRITDPESDVVAAGAAVREAARQTITALNESQHGNRGERNQVSGAVEEIFDVADRIAKLDDADVIWVSDSDHLGPDVRVAPLTVAGLLRERILSERRVIMTSATCTIGGDFDRLAASAGLAGADRVVTEPADGHQARQTESDQAESDQGSGTDGATAARDDEHGAGAGSGMAWSGLDVGSPFDYRRQAMLYVARHLPKPGREGISASVLGEITDLVVAADGRTLGLFSSRRAAEAAASHLRTQRPDLTILCQGELQLGELTRRFVDEERACLFGTLSLWQGLDVPGPTCRQVIIDRIPFPRPDDPLMSARQQAVDEAGGNGFMAVSATHAGLLLAQGAGRLIRRTTDRGVVAILDPRLATAGYASFLRAGLPDMWPTTRRDVVLGSLRRLSGQTGT